MADFEVRDIARGKQKSRWQVFRDGKSVGKATTKEVDARRRMARLREAAKQLRKKM